MRPRREARPYRGQCNIVATVRRDDAESSRMFVLLRRACAPRARIRSRYNMCLCFRLLGLAGHEAKSLLTLLKANATSLSPTPRRDDEKGCIVSAYLFARGCFLDTSVLSLTALGWRAWGKPDLSNIEIFSCLYKILYSSILGCRRIFSLQKPPPAAQTS